MSLTAVSGVASFTWLDVSSQVADVLGRSGYDFQVDQGLQGVCMRCL